MDLPPYKSVSAGLRLALDSGRPLSEFEKDTVRLLIKEYARNSKGLHHSDTDGEHFI